MKRKQISLKASLFASYAIHSVGDTNSSQCFLSSDWMACDMSRFNLHWPASPSLILQVNQEEG